MSDFLEQIVSRTRARLANAPVDAEDLRLAARRAAEGREAFGFSRALGGKAPRIIAEIKAASPSAGSIIAEPDVEAIAADYARGGAAAISIVTEPEFFRGSQQWIARAASSSRLPVVMKDFIVEPQQLFEAVAAGASAVLLLASLLDAATLHRFIHLLDQLSCDALVEAHDEEELGRALEAGARIVGINNRNLRDFRVDLSTAESLSARIPKGAIRVAESGIQTRADVDRLRASGYTAFLVGESLLRQNDRAAAVRALVEP